MRLIDADAFKTWIDEYVSVFKKSDKAEIKGYISHQPSIDIPQWIPCSERLPSESGRYLVVYPLLINKPWVSILWYGKPTFPEKDEPCFYASDDEYGDVEYSDVIAWMPLPKPYGEREGE